MEKSTKSTILVVGGLAALAGVAWWVLSGQQSNLGTDSSGGSGGGGQQSSSLLPNYIVNIAAPVFPSFDSGGGGDLTYNQFINQATVPASKKGITGQGIAQAYKPTIVTTNGVKKANSAAYNLDLYILDKFHPLSNGKLRT